MFLRALNRSSPRQNDRHIGRRLFQGIFLNENGKIPSQIFLKFVPKSPSDNNSDIGLGNGLAPKRPLLEPMLTQFTDTDTHWGHELSLSIYTERIFLSNLNDRLAFASRKHTRDKIISTVVWL